MSLVNSSFTLRNTLLSNSLLLFKLQIMVSNGPPSVLHCITSSYAPAAWIMVDRSSDSIQIMRPKMLPSYVLADTSTDPVSCDADWRIYHQHVSFTCGIARRSTSHISVTLGGSWSVAAMYESRRILMSILCLTGSQWKRKVYWKEFDFAGEQPDGQIQSLILTNTRKFLKCLLTHAVISVVKYVMYISMNYSLVN